MKQRLIYIDNLKAFAIILVVLGHVIQNTPNLDYEQNHLFRYIYSFHMPLFMLISGYCCSIRNISIKDVINKRFFQLIVPFLTWAFISQFLGGPSIIKVFVRPINGLWFLYALFFINVLFVGLYKFSNCYNISFLKINVIGCCVLFVIGFIFREKFGLGDIAWHYPFLLGGYYLKYKHQNLLHNYTQLILVFLFWLIMGWFWMRKGGPSLPFDVNFIHSKSIMYIWRLTTAILGVLAFISLFKLYTNDIHIKSILFIGTNTLGIYAIHFHLIWILQYIPESISQNAFVYLTLSVIIITGISCMLVSFFKRNAYIAALLLGSPLCTFRIWKRE